MSQTSPEEQAHQNAQATGAARTVPLGGKMYILSAPLPSDETTLLLEFQRQALEAAKTPLQSIAADLPLLTLQAQKWAVEEATRTQAGADGKSEPTIECVLRRQLTPAGAAFRFWWYARKNHPELTLEIVKPLITDENVWQVLSDIMPTQEAKKNEAPKTTSPT